SMPFVRIRDSRSSSAEWDCRHAHSECVLSRGRVERSHPRAIVVRHPRYLRDVASRLQLTSIALEVLDEVAAVLKGIHDVAEGVRVLEAEGVSELVEAREVDDGVAK